MSDYKLVPIGPTPEMVEAAEDAYMPFGDMDLAIRMALLAAPAVQGEPVGRVKTVGGYPDESEHTVEWLCKYKDLKDGDLLYTAPQPAEQQPGLLDDDSPAYKVGEIGNQIHNLGCEYQNDEALADRLAEIAHQAWMLQSSVMISKQQPEPDVARHAAMRFALSEMVTWYENISLGNNPAFQYYNLAKKALLSAALTAHRKQEGEK